MNYALQDLLRVREFRETSRGNDMKAKKILLDQAEITARRKKGELADYRIWRVNREDILYEEVKGRHIRLKDLDDLKQKVGLLREKEALLENDLMEAEKARESAETTFIDSRDAYHFAVREKKKIEEHKKIWMKDATKEYEQAQDKEMEEFQRLTAVFDMEEEDDEDI